MRTRSRTTEIWINLCVFGFFSFTPQWLAVCLNGLNAFLSTIRVSNQCRKVEKETKGEWKKVECDENIVGDGVWWRWRWRLLLRLKVLRSRITCEFCEKKLLFVCCFSHMQAPVRGKCVRFDCMWLTIAVQSGKKNVRIYEIISVFYIRS